MRNFKYGLLLFGALWGVAEVFAGEALFSVGCLTLKCALGSMI